MADYSNNAVRVINGGSVTTLAGNGTAGAYDGVGAFASLNGPHSIAVSPSETVAYIAEFSGHNIRAITIPGGAVSHFAGTNAPGSVNGPAASATFNSPRGVAADASTVFVADSGNNIIRIISSGIVSTLAGGFPPPAAGSASIDGVGTAAALAAPEQLAVDSFSYALYVMESLQTHVRRVIISTGAVTTLFGGVSISMAGTGALVGFSVLGGIAIPSPGTILVTDAGASVVQMLTCAAPCVAPVGSYCSSMAPDAGRPRLCPPGVFGDSMGLLSSNCSGPCTAAPGYACLPGATSPAGTLCSAGYFCAGGSAPPTPCTCPSVCPTTGLAVEPYGSYWSGTTIAGSLNATSGTRDGLGTSALFLNPRSIAVGANSSVAFISMDNGAATVAGGGLRALLPNASVTTVAGCGAYGFYNGVGTSATFNRPLGVTCDPSGTTAWLADYSNNAIRAVAYPSGVTTTLAGSGVSGSLDGIGVSATLAGPHYLTYYSGGASPSLFVSCVADMRVRAIVVATGVVTTLAGAATGYAAGIGLGALFDQPKGLAVVGSVLYVADTVGFRLRAVALDAANYGTVTLLAGSGIASTSIVDGAGTSAVLGGGEGMTVDAAGSLFVGEMRVSTDPCLIRRVAPMTGAVDTPLGAFAACTSSSGASMALGYNGGGGGLAFNNPSGLAFEAAGTLLVADNAGQVIRRLTCAPCPPGSWCSGGRLRPCPAGSFNGGSGATSPASCLPCSAPPGSACGEGSTSMFGMQCGAGLACAGGSALPIPCACGASCTAGTSVDPGGLWSAATLVGNGAAGIFDGVGTAATLKQPRGITTSGGGWPVYWGEAGGGIIRSLASPSSSTSTLAGSGTAGAANGIGAAASFNSPEGLSVDTSGNVIVADYANGLVRAVTASGGVASTLIAVTAPSATAVDGTGAVYIASQSLGKIYCFNNTVLALLSGVGLGFADGSAAIAKFSPTGLSALPGSPSPQLFVADYGNHRVRVVTLVSTPFSSRGTAVTLAGTGVAGWADGAATAAQFQSPLYVAADAFGSVFVAEAGATSWGGRVRRVSTTTGWTSTLAAGGWAENGANSAAAATFSGPQGIAVLATGVLLVTDSSNNRIRTLTCSSPCSPGMYGANASSCAPCSAAPGFGCISGSSSPAGSLCAAGYFCPGGASPPIACACPGACAVRGLSTGSSGAPAWAVRTIVGNGVAASVDGVGTAASVFQPAGLALSVSGSVLGLVEYGGRKLRLVDLTNFSTTTLAGSGGSTTVSGFGTAAGFSNPQGIAPSPSGGWYVTEAGCCAIRNITAAGNVTIITGGSGSGFVDGAIALAKFANPAGIAVDSAGVIWVGDQSNSRIRAIDTVKGTVRTLCGTGTAGQQDSGNSSLATLGMSTGIAFLSSGAAVFTDITQHNVRLVSAVSGVSHVAGSGVAGYVDGPFFVAQFSSPVGVAVVAENWLYVTEGAGRVRSVSPAGVVSTIAGGAAGFSDGWGTAALFTNPAGIVASQNSSMLYMSDQNGNRIRALTCSQCAVGFWCAGGVPTLCAAGTFGAVGGLSSSNCSGRCTSVPGWGCPAGSTSAAGALCPGGHFCPGGSTAPQRK